MKKENYEVGFTEKETLQKLISQLKALNADISNELSSLAFQADINALIIENYEGRLAEIEKGENENAKG